ncbi:MAG: MFS transporter [Alphaproteobacteria bacterium]|nr:MFS transporter [Alphaproteobacteria bacterium]
MHDPRAIDPTERVLRRHAATYFALLGASGAWLPCLALFLTHQGWTPGAIGLVFTAMAVVRLFAGPTWAMVADGARPGHRLFSGLLLVAAVASLLMRAASPLVAVTALLVMAALRAPASVLLDADIVRTLEAGGRPPARYGRLRLWGSLGYLLVGSAAAWGVERWPDVVPVTTATLLVAAALLHQGGSAAKAPAARPGRALLAVARDPVLSLLGVGAILHGASLNAWDAWFPTLLVARGWGAGWQGVALTVAIGCEVAVFANAPRLLRRAEPIPWLVIAGAVGAVRLAVTGWADSLAVVLAVQALHGVALGAWWTALVEATRRRAPDAVRASAQALLVSAAYGVGPALGGLSATALGRHAMPGVFLVAALFALAGAAVTAVAGTRVPAVGEARPAGS